MHKIRSLRRSILLAASLLSGCAAANVPAAVPVAGAGPDPAPSVKVGASGAFLAGRFAVSQNDMGFASDEFLRALSMDPHDPLLQQQTFLALLLDGRPEAVRLARQEPDNPAARLLLGDAAVQAGRWDAAEAYFQGLPKAGLTQILGPLLVAWAQAGAGHTDAAISTLQPMIQAQRLGAIYALHAALIADLAGRTEMAGRYYRTAEAQFGGPNLQLSRMLASWDARQGHLKEAQDTIQTLIASGNDLTIAEPALIAHTMQREVRRPADGMAEAYLALASALHAQDQNQFSTVLLRLALDLKPDFTAARLLSSDIDDAAKRPEIALRTLAPVPADDPLIGVVLLRRAALNDQVGNTEEAIRILDQMARDYPNRPEPLTLKGDILRQKHRFADAVVAYDGAIARVPNPGRNDWVLFYDRGISLDRAHNWPKAQADFERALALYPDQPYVLNYLGYSWIEQGRNLTQARQMIARAVEQRPNDGSIVDSLGWAMLRQGDVPGAVTTLEKAVELDPADPDVNGHLGDAYWAAGRKLEARFQWQRALTLNPEPDTAARIEAKLKDGDVTKSPATAEKSVPLTTQ